MTKREEALAKMKAYIETDRVNMTGKTLNFTRGEIYKFKDGKYYVVVKSAENVTIKDSYKQVPDLEFDKYNNNGPKDSNIFVKVTGYDVENNSNNRYYRENGYKVWDQTNHCYKRRNIIEHGTLIVKGTGEVYIYVGTGTNIPYDDLDINDTDYILLRGKRENDDSIGRY